MAKAARTTGRTQKSDHSQRARSGSSCVRIECSKHALAAASLAGATGVAALVFSWWCYSQQAKHINNMAQWADLTYSREVRVDAWLMARGVDTEKLFGPIPKPPNIANEEK